MKRQLERDSEKYELYHKYMETFLAANYISRIIYPEASRDVQRSPGANQWYVTQGRVDHRISNAGLTVRKIC